MKIDIFIMISIGILVLIAPEFTYKGTTINFGDFRYVLGLFLIIYPLWIIYNSED